MPTLPTRSLAIAPIVLAFASFAAAQIPAGYYDSATGTGTTLKSQLHNIIDGHTVFSYGDARTILQVTDRDPDDPDRMLLVYDRVSRDVSAINSGSIPGWDSGVSWNREHTWPRSRNVGSSGPDNSDLHQLRPSNNNVNSDRGNLNFGGEYGQQGFGQVSDGGTFWYPGDADAGMIARQEFYMAVRYDGSDGSTDDLELTNGNPSSGTPNLGNLSRLLEWHYEAAPDGFEQTRNNIIYDDYQGNRNPFIDRPEFVWSVFVDQANDTRLTVAGGSSSADGSSSRTIDLGRVYAGAAGGPANQSVTLNKAGVDGTYYRVSSTGDAFSNAGTLPRPVAMGGAFGDSIDVGLTASNAVAGEYTGSVVIDNLDVTTGGGTGRGANDGNDVIDLTYSVLNHPVASFVEDSILNTATFDFGEIALGSGLVTEGLDFFNYDGIGGPSFAADLDFDSLSSLGDASVLSLDALLTDGIEQGTGLGFDAVFDTSSAGSFEATYTFNLSGEDLPGEQTQTLSLTLLGEVIDPLVGDYNSDGMVDAADYTVYRDTLGSTDNLSADGNNDGVVNAPDLAAWQAGYGDATAFSNAVPEPTTAWLLMLVGGAVVRPARRG